MGSSLCYIHEKFHDFISDATRKAYDKKAFGGFIYKAE